MLDVVFVFGNPDSPVDSLPLRILPELRARFQNVRFETKDPNEEWDIPEELVVIDTVVGIDGPRVFTSLKNFVSGPRVSIHDFDAFTNMRLLEKLGRLKRVRIIGLPPECTEAEAISAVSDALRQEKRTSDGS